jgi:hypothetical protein
LLSLHCLGIGFRTGMVAATARSGASARWLEDRPPAVALEQGRGGPSSIPPPATVLRPRGRASATGEAGGVVKLAAATRRSEERRRSAGGDAPPLPLGWRRVEPGAKAVGRSGIGMRGPSVSTRGNGGSAGRTIARADHRGRRCPYGFLGVENRLSIKPKS